MESQTLTDVAEPPCQSCGAPVTSATHIHHCLRDRLDSARYAELFWEEA